MPTANEMVGLQPVEFYENYNLAREFGWTPSIVNMLGGVSNLDSYTPLGAARYTAKSYGEYLQKTVGTAPQQLVDYLYKVADDYGLDRDKAYKQIQKESNFNPSAVGKQTRYGQAVGIAQFLESTAQQYGLADRRDPYKSLDAYGRYMRDLLDQFDGDYSKAEAAYNWGPQNVINAIQKYGNDWLKSAPAETQDYVAGISGGRECGLFDIGCYVENFTYSPTGKDVSKRVALVLAGIVIIAVAIISLR